LELCQAPYRYFDLQGIVTDIFKTYKLKYFAHAKDSFEEKIQDILDYDIALERTIDFKKISLTHATNLSRRNHLLETRDRLITAKLQGQEVARIIEEQVKKSKTEESFQKALELQRKLDDVALKKELVQPHSNTHSGSSHTRANPVGTLPEVADVDPLSPPCFSQTLVISLVEKHVIPFSKVVPEVNIRTSLENVIDPKPILHVSVSKLVPPPSIEVSDDEILITPKNVKDSEILVETIVTPIPESSLFPSSESKESQAPEVGVFSNPESIVAPSFDLFISASSELSLFPSSESVQALNSGDHVLVEQCTDLVEEMAPEAHVETTMVINVGHDTSILGN